MPALTDPETAAVAAVLTDLERAWNAGDGPAYGASFTDDATFVTILGTVLHGRAAIGAGHQGIFDSIYAGSRVRYALASARIVGPDLLHAVVDAELVVPAGPMAGTSRAVGTHLLVRGDAGWSITAFHNTLVNP